MQEWILCPVCGNKTRVRIRDDSELKNFPLFCPKCRRETLIDVKERRVSVIGGNKETSSYQNRNHQEPDAETQSR